MINLIFLMIIMHTRDKIIFISGSLTSTFIPMPGVGGVKPPVLTSNNSTL